MTKEKFIEKSNKIHNNKYDYSEVQYIDNNTKVCIICPIHGKFYQKPKLHIKGYGNCPDCAKKETAIKRTKNTDWFIRTSI